MDKRKWYNKTIVDVPIGFVLVASCTFLFGTYLKNVLKYGTANILAVLVIGSCILVACLGSAMLVRAMYHRYNRSKVALAVVGVIVILVLVAFVLVEFIFPFAGFQLRKDHVPFHWGEFMSKTFNALFTIAMATIGYGFYLGKIRKEKTLHDLEKAAIINEKLLAESKTDVLLHASQSHYAKHVLADLVAHAVSRGDEYTAEQVAHIGKTFDYVAEAAQQDMPIVPIHRALTYFRQAADSIRLRRGEGEGTVVIKMRGDPTMQLIGPLTLTTLLENSDTHGRVDVAHPIRASFVFSRGRLEFRCTNAKRTKMSTRPTSGRGLSFVNQELTMLARHQVSLDIYEDEATYTVCLTIIYQ